MPGTASISGIVSGMKTDEIIAKLMELSKAPLNRLQTQKTALQKKISTWQELNTRILALKTKAATLADPLTFQTKSFSSSNTDLLTGSVSSSAQAGTYFIKVNTTAKTHQIASQGFADTTSSSVGTGTVTVNGTTITIGATNNTLVGLRDAINSADAGVTASIINDGSATAPYRLLITSKTGGTAGQITVDMSGLTGGTAPAFTTMQAAQDASLTLGEGAGAVTVTKGTNTISDLIPGVTLNVKDADASKTVTVQIEQDTAATKKAIHDFVDQYNNLIDYIGPQFKYNADAKSAGTLFADTTLQTILSDLRSDLSDPVSGLNQTIKVLSQIGITSTLDDKLQVDDTKLDAALADDLTQVQKLLAKTGEATNSNVSFFSATSSTKPSGTSGYAVNITQVATQSYVVASGAQTGPLAQSETLTINGVQISLSVGMTQAQVLTRINEYTNQTGVAASINTHDGSNYLMLKRSVHGSGGHITVQSSVSANTNPGANSGIGNVSVTETAWTGELGTGLGAAGLDVQGTINGEAATGMGQYLTGDSTNTNTAGLKIRFTGITTGSFGSVTFTRGIAGLLADYADNITAIGTGAISSAEDGIQARIKDIDDDIDRLNERLAAQQMRLIEQFTAMENALGQLQNQSAQLAAQLNGK